MTEHIVTLIEKDENIYHDVKDSVVLSNRYDRKDNDIELTMHVLQKTASSSYIGSKYKITIEPLEDTELLCSKPFHEDEV